MNRLFVAYKPRGLSSNAFLNSLKKKYKITKAGFSGTLDPFACGTLIIAFNQYTKLFRFLAKTPKLYKATIWLGASSLSFDDKNIQKIDTIKAFEFKCLESLRKELLGELEFTPPQYSAKRVGGGKRAYDFAKKGQKVELKKCLMQVYESEILSYNHPFLNIKLSLSEGGYVRSYCELFAKKLGINATLSSLERLSEGKFYYEDEKSLDILSYLDLPYNSLKDQNKLENGTKIHLSELEIQKDGVYIIKDKEFFSIISIINDKVSYILNKVKTC